MKRVKRNLPYTRQYVIIAVYDILDNDGVQYEKTNETTIIAEISVYGNKSVFSISVNEHLVGTELTVSVIKPCEGLSEKGKYRAATAVADRISQYLENEMELNISGT